MTAEEVSLENFGRLPPPTHCYAMNHRQTGYDREAVAEATWQIILEAGLIIDGDFTFAAKDTSEVMVDFGLLERNQGLYSAMLWLYGTHPCIQDADLLLDVPYGVREFTRSLSTETGIDVVHAELIDPTDKHSGYTLTNDEDKEKILTARHPLIIEDVVSTLGSVARLRELFPYDRNVHALAMLLREKWPDSKNCSGLVTHYLLHKVIPRTKEELAERIAAGWAEKVE